MDVSLRIRQRLSELGIDQKDLAAAAQVTESYISQLLTRKKAPPAPGRTEIYERISSFLKLPPAELEKLAAAQRLDEARRRVAEPPGPLFGDFRELLLRKCGPRNRPEIRRIFEKDAFGELERLVTQKVLAAAQRAAQEELQREDGGRLLARVSERRYEHLRVSILEFLDTDVRDVSVDSCVSFLEPMIEAWDISLETFSMEIILNRQLTRTVRKRYEFTERPANGFGRLEPGLQEFLADEALSGDAAENEIAFLKTLRFGGLRPTPLYYYRELQNLRDPLHFGRSQSEDETAGTGNDGLTATSVRRPR